VLRLAANNLRKTLRVSDFAFRIGGDEFALLLPQSDPDQAATICRRVRNNFEVEVAPLKMSVAVALDFGMAAYPQDGDTKETLVQLADERLYALKHATGRVIPIETPSAPRETPSPLREAAAAAAAAPATPAIPTIPRGAAQQKPAMQPR